MDMTSATTQVAADGISPELMARAKVPFAMALWYHAIGRRLTRFTEWDIDRIMQVRTMVASTAPG
jgi:hypothetical protein